MPGTNPNGGGNSDSGAPDLVRSGLPICEMRYSNGGFPNSSPRQAISGDSARCPGRFYASLIAFTCGGRKRLVRTAAVDAGHFCSHRAQVGG
jgi:hypothetical protein